MKNHKHKRGDRFMFEIAEVHTHYTDDGNAFPLYRVKGMNTCVFDNYGLERMEKVENGYYILFEKRSSDHKHYITDYDCVGMVRTEYEAIQWKLKHAYYREYKYCPFKVASDE